ncbi:hypothetical protein DFP74_2483 [Nocardiopsis sp. Huas11]|nr:hypothetical protein DFP74_2483 [Nocardiopsis sp. Huas11]
MLLLLLLLCVVLVAACWPFHAQFVSERRLLLARITRAREQLDEPGAGLLRVHETLTRDIALVRGGHAPEEAAQTLGTAEDDLRRADELIRLHNELSRTADEGRFGFRPSRLADADRAWRELEQDVRTYLPRLDEHEARLSAVVADTGRIPQRTREAEDLVGEVTEVAEAGRDEGFVVTGETRVLGTAAERLAQVRSLVAERRLIAAVGPLSTLVDELTAARDALRSLRRRQETLAAGTAGLRADQERLTGRRVAAEAALSELLDHHAPSNAEGIAERVAAGSRALDRAGLLAGEAGEALAARDVHRGERAVAEARDAHERAEEELAAPEQRLARVRELSRSLPYECRVLAGRTEQVGKRALKAQETRPLAPVAAGLRAAVERLDVAARRPDWLVIEARLAETSALLDPLDKAVEEVARAAWTKQKELDRVRGGTAQRTPGHRPSHRAAPARAAPGRHRPPGPRLLELRGGADAPALPRCPEAAGTRPGPGHTNGRALPAGSARPFRVGPQPRRAAASRASASTLSHAPADTRSVGVSQLPPTQPTLGSAR